MIEIKFGGPQTKKRVSIGKLLILDTEENKQILCDIKFTNCKNNKMRYSTYINMGNAYDKEHNRYNAILAYQYAISKEEPINLALNNVTCTLFHIGLQFEALNKINKCISNFERGKGGGRDPWMYYCNRGLLLGWLGKDEAMRSDLSKSLTYKSTASNDRNLAVYELKDGNIENAENLYSTAIEKSEPGELCFNLLLRGEFYYVIKDFLSALTDFQQALELASTDKPSATSSRLAERATYFLGKIYHEMGDFYHSNKYYFSLCKLMLLSESHLGKFDIPEDIDGFLDDLKNKKEDVFSESYPKYDDITQVGIVLSIDEKKGFGFVLGKTIFNPYDSIYFRISDSQVGIKRGDRVKFQIGYHKRNGKYSVRVVKLQKHDSISDIRFRVHNIYHAVVVSKQCAFRSNNTKYVEIFYPLRTFIAYDRIAANLNSRLIERITERGFAFIEIDMVVLDSGELEFNSIKEISIKNSFSDKYVQVRYDQSERKISNWRGLRSKWSCFVCDGNEDTGCLMSDPQNCPNGKGI